MRKIKITMMAFCLGFLCLETSAQDNSEQKERIFKLKYQPSFVDNYSYKVFYLSEGKVYNLMNYDLAEKLENVQQMSIQPGGATCAVLINKGGKARTEGNNKGKAPAKAKKAKIKSWIEIYSANSKNAFMAKITDTCEIATIAFAPDGKTLATSFQNQEVKLYDTKEFKPYTSFKSNIVPSIIALSENNYFAALADGQRIDVWNLQDKSIRTTIESTAKVNSVAFSADNSMMAVLTAGGTLNVYETRSFTQRNNYSNMNNGLCCYFHPDNKYIGVVTDENTIVLQNVRNTSDKTEIKSFDGGINNLRFVQDLNKIDNTYLLYPTGYGVVFQSLANLQPNRSQQLTDAVNAKMNEWMKMMDGESMEDYRIRVNDETRAIQQLAFEREIATDMAGDMIAAQTIRLGNYNSQKELLAFEFDGMPSIVLDIPKDEVASFSNMADLSFTNTVYGINENDQFEVIYTEVLNTKTGKKYIYDNLDRKSVTAMSVEEGFVPLELVQQSSIEEMKLKDIRKQVVETAKKENKITDHTHINVNTQVLSDVDASGKSIMNYKVSYGYEVEKEFVSKDDFPLGHYKIRESNAAISMLKIVEQAFANDFAQYIKAGKRIRIKITGSADAAPILSKIAYDGCYGEFANELVYKNGQLSNITVNKASGITQNEQLAFMRAQGVKFHIEEHIPALKDMACDYQYNIEISDKKGGEFRRISVEFIFIDAFEQ